MLNAAKMFSLRGPKLKLNGAKPYCKKLYVYEYIIRVMHLHH